MLKIILFWQQYNIMSNINNRLKFTLQGSDLVIIECSYLSNNHLWCIDYSNLFKTESANLILSLNFQLIISHSILLWFLWSFDHI